MTQSAKANPRQRAGWQGDNSNENCLNEAAQQYTDVNKAARLEVARSKLVELQAAPGFDVDDFVRWRVEGFAIDFGITYGEAVRLCRETTPKTQSSNWNFRWLAELNVAHTKNHVGLKGLKVGIALFSFSNSRHNYIWPSAKTIIATAGWSDRNRRSLYEGLNELEEIHAVRRIKFKNLPVKILEGIEAAANSRPRDPRTMAYAITPIEEWKMVDESTMGRQRSVSPWETLNYKVKQQPASQDSSTSSFGESPLTFQQVDRSKYGTEGGRYSE